MNFFNLEGFTSYSLVSKEAYSASTDEAKWYYDTRDKLKYLISLLSKELNQNLHIVYNEKPNGQAGRAKIIFKDYILVGFGTTTKHGDDLFMKVSFANLKDSPAFSINIDLNFRKGTSPYLKHREDIYNGNHHEWLIDDNFPKNWESLISLIRLPFIDMFERYELLITDSTNIVKCSNGLEMSELGEVLRYKKQIILQGPPGTGKTRKAKLIAKDLLNLTSIIELEDNEQFKLIQFHPSYTYEDFVRGIASKPNEEGDGIIYEAENRILAHFAAKALKNYQLSRADTQTKDKVLNLDSFINYVIERLDLDDKYMISDKVYIYMTDDRRFKYKGDNWTAHPKGLNMNYSELEKIIELNLNSRQEINKNADLNALTRQHATYYQNVIELYKKFIEDFKSIEQIRKVALKNYVLIIDEINRANLSSVLGELIYALEYRGETVESMYEVNGSKKITLPPNLFIIGTMNTADRSVGHIDYAIRRRFAFVDVPPQKLQNTDEIWFDVDGFEAVNALFNSVNVSNEFEINDVRLGHSYFIAEKKDATTESKRDNIFKVKMEHEVKPILLEYVKDGILINKINDKEIKEYILAL